MWRCGVRRTGVALHCCVILRACCNQQESRSHTQEEGLLGECLVFPNATHEAPGELSTRWDNTGRAARRVFIHNNIGPLAHWRGLEMIYVCLISVNNFSFVFYIFVCNLSSHTALRKVALW